MRTINTNFDQKAEKSRLCLHELAKKRGRVPREQAISYLNEVHMYRFKIGDEITSETSQMLGRSALELNRDLRQKFAEQVSKAYPNRTEARLCRWVMVDRIEGQAHRPTVFRPRSEDKCEIPKGLQYE